MTELPEVPTIPKGFWGLFLGKETGRFWYDEMKKSLLGSFFEGAISAERVLWLYRDK
jgi:hypothetical protein